MSSSPSPAAAVSASLSMRPLRIDVDVPTLEIFILDGNGIIVARGIGSVSATLPTGMYKVRYKLGKSVADELFELPQGAGEFTPSHLPPLPMVTPVPLVSATDGNMQPSVHTVDLATAWSMTTHVKAGSGSSLFLFVNASNTPSNSSRALGLPPYEVTVSTFAGVVVASLAQGASESGCLGCTIEIAPDGYVLSVARGDRETVSQAVYCAPGWQTQIFLPVVQDTTQVDTVDPSTASILMSPSRFGFRSDSRSALWAEAARKTLASGRANVTPVSALRNMAGISADDPMIEEMLDGKYLNPMLGIYGAHLMAIQNSPDNRDVLEEVVSNLRKLVGDIPDVMALQLYLDASAADGLRLPNPPMLASSWEMIVRASVQEPEIVPVDSPAARIAGTLWGSGAWLGWKAPDFQDKVSTESSKAEVSWNSFKQAVAPALSWLGSEAVDLYAPKSLPNSAVEDNWALLKQAIIPALTRVSEGVTMTPVERTVISYVGASVNRQSLLPDSLQRPIVDLNSTDAADTDKMMAAMALATGIPSSVLRTTVASLISKSKERL